MLILDSSAVVGFMDKGDRNYARAVKALKANRGPYVVPTPILAEIAFMIETRLGSRQLSNFLADLGGSKLTLDCCDHDFPRILELYERYASLPLGLADAAVIACAERLDQPVLAYDQHFGVVAKEGKLKLAQ